MPRYQKNALIHLPPNCGMDLQVPLLRNPYQEAFQTARRRRVCGHCGAHGLTGGAGVFECPNCKMAHTSNITAPRVFDRFLALAGRGGGKTLVGAHAAREEMMVPNSIGWVMGPTYKILHDSTFPTLIRLIPPEWVRRWDADHMELTLINGALVAFRSLEDPERARGPHGVSWGWLDEAAQCPERAYDVFEPTLIKAGGIVICTTTVLGFDWTYDKIEKRAASKMEGYFAVKWWTEENPLFQSNPVMRKQIERAKATMDPDFYAQEYKAERRNAKGLIYNFKLLEELYLPDAGAVRKYIPEWPAIDPSRPVLVGLDSGADHPFGAVKLVVTERGLVVVGRYLKREQAISQHIPAIHLELGISSTAHPTLTWAANKNERNLRLEFGLKNIGVVPAENKHEVGIQRVQSWLYSRQLVCAYTAADVWDQMKAYRYADNLTPDGQKKNVEQVFKKADEYPDCIRYAVMAWPALPEVTTQHLTDREKDRLASMDERTLMEIARVKEFNKKGTATHLQLDEPNYPLGEFFGSPGNEDEVVSFVEGGMENLW